MASSCMVESPLHTPNVGSVLDFLSNEVTSTIKYAHVHVHTKFHMYMYHTHMYNGETHVWFCLLHYMA